MANLFSDDFYRKIANGEIPFTTSIHGSGDEHTAIEVLGSSVVIDGVETIMIDKPIKVGIGGAREGSEQSGKATLQVYPNNPKKLIVNTQGSGRVAPHKFESVKLINLCEPLVADDGVHKIIVTTAFQRDENQQTIEVLFINRNQVRKEGKNHPHILLNLDASGKFMKLRGFNVEIKSESIIYSDQNYHAIPSCLRIIDTEFNKEAVIEFLFNEKIGELVISAVSLV